MIAAEKEKHTNVLTKLLESDFINFGSEIIKYNESKEVNLNRSLNKSAKIWSFNNLFFDKAYICN